MKAPLPLIVLPLLLLLQSAQCKIARTPIFPAPSSSPQQWRSDANADMQAAQRVFQQLKQHAAKNVLFFLGDGMGMTTVTAGRILKGQLQNVSGEETKLSFETMPHTALLKTYNTDMQTPDSGGTGTAFLCGVKARTSTVGVDQSVDTRNCSSFTDARKVTSFLEEAANAGKSVGIVTTTRITHATPAAAYAHSVSRNWESDSDQKEVPLDQRDRCPDIAHQLITKSAKFSVIFGGGRLKFLPKNVTTNDRANKRMLNGSRSDGVNLVTRWKELQTDKRFAYIETRDELMNMSVANTDTVLGLFATSHLRYDIDNSMDTEYKEPTITEMTTKAIEILSKNPNGFALLVEGGRIDHGHHDNLAVKALYDVVAFDSAIEAGMSRVSVSDTLTIVTADHSHVFTVGAWSGRGNNILGKVRFSYENRYDSNGDALGTDLLPYTPLAYTDGPSAPANMSRKNISGVDTADVNYAHSSMVPFLLDTAESHGAEDVPIYASGPNAHLLHTTHEQSYVGNLVKYAICVGEYRQNSNCPSVVSSACLVQASFLVQFVLVVVSILMQKTA